MLYSGDYDLMRPLFSMFLNSLPLARERPRIYCNHAGAFYPETQCFWGTYHDSNYGRDREGRDNGWTLNTYIRYYWSGGLELAMMLLDYHAHTQDEAFVRQVLLPLESEILTFFDRHWERDAEGVICFDPAESLETYHQAVNPLAEIAGIQSVVKRTLTLPEHLTTCRQRQDWQRLL